MKDLIDFLKRFPITLLKVYPKSFTVFNGLTYGLIRIPEGKRLVVMGEKGALVADPFRGEIFSGTPGLKVCDLLSENTECLMSLFPYTKPAPVLKYRYTLGTGDRLQPGPHPPASAAAGEALLRRRAPGEAGGREREDGRRARTAEPGPPSML